MLAFQVAFVTQKKMNSFQRQQDPPIELRRKNIVKP
jgi:hypothetical protein